MPYMGGDVYGLSPWPGMSTASEFGRFLAPIYCARPAESKGDVFILDTKSRSLSLLMRNGWFSSEDIDSGRGFLTVQQGLDLTPDPRAPRSRFTYDLASGKLLSSIRTRPGHRVGGIFVEDGGWPANSTPVWYDVVTGRQRYDIPEPYRERVVDPIWNGPTDTLTRVSRARRGEPTDEFKDLVEFRGTNASPSHWAPLSHQILVSRIVGNPEEGAFAIMEADGSGRWTALSGVFSRTLKRFHTRLQWVTDVGPRGILGERGHQDGLGNWHLSRVLCLRQDSGKVIWSAPYEMDSWTDSPRWVGNNVLAGRSLLDGRTGRQIGKLTPPRSGHDLGWINDLFVRTDNNSARRIVAYKIEVRP